MVCEFEDAHDALRVFDGAPVDAYDEVCGFIGGAQTGKTQTLATMVRDAVRNEKGSVLVLCGSEAGLRDMRNRLRGPLGDGLCMGAGVAGADRVRLMLARDAALEIVSAPEARALFHREPRLLDSFEEQFLFEDVRTTAFKGRRLREVTAFLRSGWSRLADDDPNWVISLEEEAVIASLRNNLEFTGGIMPCELGNFAVNTLRSEPSVRERFLADFVIVDDFSLLDRAKQVLARMLARHVFAFAADPSPALAALDEFPYPQGVSEVLEACPKAHVEHLKQSAQPPQLQNAVARLRAEEARVEVRAVCGGTQKEAPCASFAHSCSQPSCEECSVRAAMGAGMDDELRAIEEICRNAIDAGQGVLLVGINGLWRANVARRLSSAGLSFERVATRISIKDFRDERACSRAKQATMARLAQNPHDGVAWRSLVGFEDYMARSTGLESLRLAAQPLGLGIEEALRRLSEGTLEGADSASYLYASLLAAYEKARVAVDGCSAAPAHEERCGAAAPAPNRDTLAFAPDICGNVVMCSPREAAGLRVPVVVLGGFVNGIIPSRAFLDGSLLGERRRRARLADMRTLRGVAECAQQALYLTGFTSCSLEAAERLGLHIARIKLKRGVRVCTVEPSALLSLIESD